MSMIVIRREPPQPVSITANSSAQSTAGHIAYGPYAGGGIFIGNTGSATQIAWHTKWREDQTPRPVYESGAAVTTSVVVGYHPIPDACFAAPFVVPVIAGGTTMAATFVGKG
jgi:hypothetical protein